MRLRTLRSWVWGLLYLALPTAAAGQEVLTRPDSPTAFQPRANQPVPQPSPSRITPRLQPQIRLQPEPQATLPSGPNLPSPVLIAPQQQPGRQPSFEPLGAQPWDCWIVSSRGLQGPEYLQAQGQAALKFYHFQAGQKVRRGSEAEFHASLDPARPVAIFVHGGYYAFGDVLHESRIVDNWLKSGGPMPVPQLVCFTWPSDTEFPVVPLDVLVLARRSAVHGAFLAGMINRMPRQQPVSLIGHSFGGRTIAAAMHVLGGGVLEELPPCDYGPLVPRRLRGVLLAPALDHHWFNPGERYGMAPIAVEKMLIMTNTIDPILPLYPLRKPFTERAMGQGGLSRADRAAIGPLQSRIVEFDNARISGLKHNLDGFYRHPKLARVVAPFVSFTDLTP